MSLTIADLAQVQGPFHSSQAIAIGNVAQAAVLDLGRDPGTQASIGGGVLTTSYNSATGLGELDAASRAVLGGSYVAPVASSGALDTAINSLVTTHRATATANGGIAPRTDIPSGSYTWSSNSSTVTLEPWNKYRFEGPTKINLGSLNTAAVWVRNDPAAGQITQGIESDYNNSKVIDASNGPVVFVGNLTSGQCAIRVGNADGVMGSPAYSGSTSYINFLTEYDGVYCYGLDHGIEFTSNENFCTRWTNNRQTACNINLYCSSGANSNAGEQHSFVRAFWNNTNTYNISFNTTSTNQETHYVSFLHSSLTGVGSATINWTTNCIWTVNITDSRLEAMPVVTMSSNSTAAPRGTLNISNSSLIMEPSFGVGTYLRKLFTGTHALNASNVRLVLVDGCLFSNATMNDPSNQFLCDETVKVTASNVRATDPQGTSTTNANMRRQPIINKSYIINSDWEFADSSSGAAVIGPQWVANKLADETTSSGTATITRTTTAAECYNGTTGAKVVCSASYGVLLQKKMRVTPGQNFCADIVVRVDPASSTTALAITPTVTWYLEDGTTTTGTPVTVSQDATYQNWYNRRDATHWVMHPLQTGILVPPPGAAWAKVAWNFSGSASITTACTATFYVGNAPFFRLP